MWKLFDKIRRTPLATLPPDQLLQPLPAGARGVPEVDPARCDGTQTCVPACPAGAIAYTAGANATGGAWHVDVNRCQPCGLCVAACPQQALTESSRPSHASREPQPEDVVREIRRVLGRSLHIRHVDTGSSNGCDWEVTHLLNPVYDLQRFGIDFVASPRHADLLLVTGGVTRHLEEALRRTYEAAGSPRLVVAVGSCACGGGVLGPTYAHHGGVDKIVPVTVRVPGCPPRPAAILDGILLALGRRQELQPAR